MTELTAAQSQLDKISALRIRTMCSSTDYEANGSHRDRIIADLLRALGLTETLAAFEAVEHY